MRNENSLPATTPRGSPLKTTVAYARLNRPRLVAGDSGNGQILVLHRRRIDLAPSSAAAARYSSPHPEQPRSGVSKGLFRVCRSGAPLIRPLTGPARDEEKTPPSSPGRERRGRNRPPRLSEAAAHPSSDRPTASHAGAALAQKNRPAPRRERGDEDLKNSPKALSARPSCARPP